MPKTYKLKLTSAVVVNGQPVAAGNVVEVDEAKARRLLDAGKADLAKAEDVAPVTAEAPVEPKTLGAGADADKADDAAAAVAPQNRRNAKGGAK